MNDSLLSITKSWCAKDGVNTTEELLAWVAQRNETIEVEIHRISPEHMAPWFYDETEGCIRNQNRSFFTITGLQQARPDGSLLTQPIIVQPEIGYLGILCREIDGVTHFLMQAKIEPGNVNQIQISPTIQATKSNFTQKHGGAKPPYLEYFMRASQYERIVDQVQSEQSSRFYKKRNRNIVLRVDEEIPALSSHKWMTLGQIKSLMRIDNLVNMDTRTVLSCIPYGKLRLEPGELLALSDGFQDHALFRSIFVGEVRNSLPEVYGYINDRKMFSDADRRLIPLREVTDWEMRDGEFVCKHSFPFKIVFCDISIEGREVRHWTQPLFEATEIATFGLICCEDHGILKFLVKATPEVGCFDVLELGPTVQRETASQEEDVISRYFFQKVEEKQCVMFDHLLSEEGGRFYHEQNRNILLRVPKEELPALPDGYFWLDYHTLNELVQMNNVLNIQLRNLLSLLEA